MASSKHQHRQRKQHTFHPPPLFWNNLSRLWLTKSSLREANQRHRLLLSPRPNSFSCPCTFAPDFLRTCSTTSLQEIRRLARCGGPDLSDIRNHSTPSGFDEDSMDPTSNRTPPATVPETKPKNTTVYDQHFEEHIANHGIYLPLSKYPDGTEPSKPDNFEVIRTILRTSRPSLALPPITLAKEHERFVRLNEEAADEQLVIKNILPILEGEEKTCLQTGADHPFKKLAPLTDGTLADAMPDFYHGARRNQLHPAIREQLKDQVIPTAKSNRPIAPNFFVEAKGHYGSVPVVRRQACYDGALGARAMHSLQQFGNSSRSDCTTTTPATYDNNAYTMTSTYHSGTLGLYTTHPTQSRFNSNHPHRSTDYLMTQVGKWALDGSPESFQEGITAYRNARDLAQEQRDGFIKQANKRYASDRRQDFTAEDIDEEQLVLSSRTWSCQSVIGWSGLSFLVFLLFLLLSLEGSCD